MNAVINKPRAKKGNVAPVPVQAAEPDHPSVVVGKALTDLVKQIQEAYDSSSSLTNESCMHAHTLIEMVSEMLSSIVDGKAAEEEALMYRVAACLAGALAHDREDAPSATLRHKKLKEAYDLAESASISYGFCEEPCVGLAHGIAAGRAAGAAAGHLARREGLEVDVDDLSGELLAVNGLLGWVVRARDLCDEINVSAQIDKTLHDALKKNGIRYRTPDWQGQSVGAAIGYILSRQHELIALIAGASK